MRRKKRPSARYPLSVNEMPSFSLNRLWASTPRKLATERSHHLMRSFSRFSLLSLAASSVRLAAAPPGAGRPSLLHAPAGAWIWLLVVAAVAYAVCRRWPWLALFAVPLFLFLPAVALLEWPTSSPLTAMLPGHGNPAFLILSLCVIVIAELLGLLDGRFRIVRFLPWGVSPGRPTTSGGKP